MRVCQQKNFREENKNMTTEAEKQKKIGNIHIDFDSDNILPELNREDLEKIGAESKPVLLKKSVIERNLLRHPDVDKKEYDYLLGQALYYNPSYFPGLKNNYVNFVSKINDRDNSLVLIEMSETKSNFEIVHLMKINDSNLKRMKKRN